MSIKTMFAAWLGLGLELGSGGQANKKKLICSPQVLTITNCRVEVIIFSLDPLCLCPIASPLRVARHGE